MLGGRWREPGQGERLTWTSSLKWLQPTTLSHEQCHMPLPQDLWPTTAENRRVGTWPHDVPWPSNRAQSRKLRSVEGVIENHQQRGQRRGLGGRTCYQKKKKKKKNSLLVPVSRAKHPHHRKTPPFLLQLPNSRSSRSQGSQGGLSLGLSSWCPATTGP